MGRRMPKGFSAILGFALILLMIISLTFLFYLAAISPPSEGAVRHGDNKEVSCLLVQASTKVESGFRVEHSNRRRMGKC